MSAPKGIIRRPSSYPVSETADRLVKYLETKGIKIYARINQRSELAAAGIDIAQLEFLLFGNPKGGGPFISANPEIALDLPLKSIVWEDAAGKVWVTFNDARYIEERYGFIHDENSALHIDKIIASALVS